MGFLGQFIFCVVQSVMKRGGKGGGGVVGLTAALLEVPVLVAGRQRGEAPLLFLRLR